VNRLDKGVAAISAVRPKLDAVGSLVECSGRYR